MVRVIVKGEFGQGLKTCPGGWDGNDVKGFID